MFGYVYRTINRLNGTFYIGQHHGEFDLRYLGSGIWLIKAVKKYGKENFEVEFLEAASFQTELDALEIHFIKVHRDCGVKLYNLHEGGSGHQPGHVMAQEIRDKISKTQKGRAIPFHVREKISKSLTGRKRPASYCEIMRLKKLGTKASAETKKKMSETRKGRPVSKLHRDRISASMIGVKHSPERIAAIKRGRSQSFKY